MENNTLDSKDEKQENSSEDNKASVITAEESDKTKEKAENEKNISEKKPAKEKKSQTKKTSKKKKKSKVNNSVFGGIIAVAIVMTVSIVIAVKGISIGMEYWGVGKSENSVSFNIPENSTNDKIADILKENGIIESKNLFKLALKISKPAALYPGDITLKPSMGYTAVIEKLATRRQSYKTVTVTIPEGGRR